jgi:GNAT superfamily N-acetyltransferase
MSWGYALAELPSTGLKVALARRPGSPLAVRTGDGGLLLAEPQWRSAWQDLAATLSVEQLFSIFGVFELARTTLPDGVSPFGPVWCFLADAHSFRPVNGGTVEELDQDALRPLAPATYWHCSLESATRGFAIRHEGKLIALATVWRTPETLWEVGVDVLPAGQGRGWGRAVVSAATAWILARAPVAYYTTGAFNVPSGRTAHSLGYRHVCSVIKRRPGPFVVPPGPLGTPLPGVVPQPYWKDYPE